ncbi:MAG: hypothetical protein ACRDWD_16750 [Acidimicrobiia bacterium]
MAATERAAAILEDLGHSVAVEHPTAMDDHGAGMAIITVHTVGRAAQLAGLERMIGRQRSGADIEERLWDQVELGRSVTALQYLDAREDVMRWARAMASWSAGDHDLLVTSTVGTPAPELGVLAWATDRPREEAMLAAITLNPFTPFSTTPGSPRSRCPWVRAPAGSR